MDLASVDRQRDIGERLNTSEVLVDPHELDGLWVGDYGRV
jgi:hypothetical protein